ncbi:MAG: PIN domain-containing protein [bacterium]
MIAIDTNVLLRHLLQDDPEQSAKASLLIEQADKVLITDIVLIETIWTLLGKKYQAQRRDIIKLINDLLSERAIQFENPQAVWAALRDFQEDRPHYDTNGRKLKLPDFADTLMINKAKLIAKRDNEALIIYTFDKGAARINGVKEVT